MTPTVSRAEMNESDDIIAEPAVIPHRGPKDMLFGSPISQCEGKRAFDLRSLAETAAKRIKGRVAYRCKFCRKWHVGNKS